MDSLYCKELKEKWFLGKIQFRIQQRYRMIVAYDSLATTMDTVERIGKEFDYYKCYMCNIIHCLEFTRFKNLDSNVNLQPKDI